MPSQLFNHLHTNIGNLIVQFRDFKVADRNLNENQIKLRALHILVHAEIETYFEQLGIFVLDSYSSNRLGKKQKGKINYSILCYGSSSYAGDIKTVNDRINNNLSQLRVVISDNHGIKQKNILKILLPLNYPLALIDQTWLNTIESFGSKRGDYAHNGLHKITNLIPYNYIDGSVVNIIIPEIQKIDHFYVTNFGLI